MRTQQKFAMGLVGGMLAGATASLLWAPRSGKETRHSLALQASSLVKRTKKSGGSYRPGEPTSHRVETSV